MNETSGRIDPGELRSRLDHLASRFGELRGRL